MNVVEYKVQYFSLKCSGVEGESGVQRNDSSKVQVPQHVDLSSSIPPLLVTPFILLNQIYIIMIIYK